MNPTIEVPTGIRWNTLLQAVRDAANSSRFPDAHFTAYDAVMLRAAADVVDARVQRARESTHA